MVQQNDGASFRDDPSIPETGSLLLQLTIAGLAIGLLASFGFEPMLRGILFGVEYGDPRTFATVAAALLVSTPSSHYARSD